MNKKIKYLPLRYDVSFKGFFSKEDNKSLLLLLLNNYLKLDIQKEEDIELVNTELRPDSFEDKIARLDLHVKTKDKESINIEIQVHSQPDFLKRIYYYNSKLYVSQAKKGYKYNDLKKVMTLAFTLFDIFDNEEYKNNVYLYHKETGKQVLDDIHICIVELSKYKRLLKENKVKMDEWANLLTANTDSEFELIEERGGIMAEAVRKLKYFSQEEQDRYWPDMIAKYEMDMLSLQDYYRKEGISIGEKRGISIGKVEGLLLVDIPTKQITELTGATAEEIEEIRDKMNN